MVDLNILISLQPPSPKKSLHRSVGQKQEGEEKGLFKLYHYTTYSLNFGLEHIFNNLLC